MIERRLLRVNLKNGGVGVESIPEKTLKDFIGGRGIGIKYLYDELKPNVDPLGEENKLIFISGPLAGSGAQSASRWIVTTKSPLTGTYTRSVGGGDFAAWMRFADFDAIILEGKSEKPVYLYIEDNKYELKDAGDLWGKNTVETQESLKKIYSNRIRIACIGPAGERLVKISGILSDRRIAARGGVGAVMGSKSLKAIVINASPPPKLHDPQRFKELIKEQVNIFRAGGEQFIHFSEAGTVMPEVMNSLGIFPVKNFRGGTIDNFEKIAGDEYFKIKEKNTGCYTCMIHCGNIFHVKEGKYAGASSEGPEYESLWSFTGPINSTDIGATIAADSLCDDLGLDTISAGGAIGFAFELFEKGIITKSDTDGLELKYGDHEILHTLLKKIAYKEGFGEILSEGVKRAAEKIGKGAEKYAMHVKGQELPGYEPRGAKAHGINYATSNVGANHNYGYAMQEIFGIPIPRAVDRFAEEGKGDIVKFNQDMVALMEVGIACAFPSLFGWFNPEILSKMLVASMGMEEFANIQNLMVVGDRIYNLERAFNVREGYNRKDDVLPERFLKEPLENAVAGVGEMYRKFDKMIDEYYNVRGWNNNGIPTADKLRSLGLDYVIKDIEKFY
jgi:aldehyde:ferredoxin oxidoreductase